MGASSCAILRGKCTSNLIAAGHVNPSQRICFVFRCLSAVASSMPIDSIRGRYPACSGALSALLVSKKEGDLR